MLLCIEALPRLSARRPQSATAGQWVSLKSLLIASENREILVPTIADTEHLHNSHMYGGVLIPRRAIISERILEGAKVNSGVRA